MEPDWKLLAEKYRLESELYALNYQDYLKPLEIISAMQGVAVQMFSEMLSYQIKNGTNDKTQKVNDRLNILLNGLNDLTGLAEKTLKLRNLLAEKSKQNLKLTEENEQLKSKLKGIENAWNQM